jgi:hypothetical protein
MSELRGTWEPDPKLESAVKLWRDYYDECEAYDRTVCSGPNRNGSAMPANQDQARLINRHALQRMALLRRAENEAEIAREISDRAKDIALREHERSMR